MTRDDFCPQRLCDGSGWLLDEETNVARPCRCREQRINRAASRRLGTGIPRRFRGVSFDRRPICDLDPMLLRTVRDFVHAIDRNLDRGRGLWFYGDVGTGKTSLAMLISKAAIEAGRSVAVYSVPHLLADIKETYEDGSGRSYLELFRRLCSVDLLHLDDLGAEKRTEWVIEQLYSIVNERWQDERSIVVTTNLLDLDELREQVGARTVSRLSEMSEMIPIMGPDLRIAHPSASEPSAHGSHVHGAGRFAREAGGDALDPPSRGSGVYTTAAPARDPNLYAPDPPPSGSDVYAPDPPPSEPDVYAPGRPAPEPGWPRRPFP